MLLLLHPRPAPSHHRVGRSRTHSPSPPAVRPVGESRGSGRDGANAHCRASAAVLSGPAPLLEPAHDHHPAPLLSDCAACSAWSRHTTMVKNDGFPCGPTPRLGTSPATPRWPQLDGWSVRLPAKLTRGSAMCILAECLAGRSALPQDPGRWTPWHANRTPGAAVEPTKSAMQEGCRADGRLRCRVGWWALHGGSRASTVRPAPPPGRGRRTRLPP